MSTYKLVTTEGSFDIEKVERVSAQCGTVTFYNNYDKVLFMIAEKYFITAIKVNDGTNT